MKTVLCLLVLCATSVGWAQVASPPTASSHVILLSDIDEYVQECYNDSTEVVVHLETDRGELCTQRVKVWQHKEPTFTGFRQWLKERNK